MAQLMKTSDSGIKMIGQFEGLYRMGQTEDYAPKNVHIASENPKWIYYYIDPVGLPTIGYGHLLTKDELATGVMFIDGARVYWKIGLTMAQVINLKRQDLNRFEQAVRLNVKVPITQNMFDALVSWAFNVGVGRVSNSGSTLIRELNKRNYVGAANEFVKWNKSGGKVLKGLTNRRLAEKALFAKDIGKV